MGYMVFVKDRHHSQLMKVEMINYKKEEEVKKNPKHETLATFGERVSRGEELSTSSSDESLKIFTTRTNIVVKLLQLGYMIP